MTQPPTHPGDEVSTSAESPMTRDARQADAARRLNIWVIVLVFVIITGAFAFSAESWIGLAEVTGYRSAADAGRVVLRLSWVMPVAVDGYLCLTTWLFLSAPPGSPLRRYSGWSVFVVVVLSIVAQGVYHGLDARGVDVARVWPLVVAVGGLPPALLASSVHLLSIYLHHRAEPAEAIHRPAARVAEPPTDAEPASVIQPEPESPPPAPPTSRPTRPASPTKPQRLTVVGSRRGRSVRREVDDGTVAEAIRDHVLTQHRLGLEPVQREMVRLVQQHTGIGVGQRRCVNVAASILDGESESDSDSDKEEVLAV